MEKIRLLKFLTLFGIGGTERQVLNLIRGLDSTLFDVSIGCLRRWGPLLPEIEACGIQVAEYRTTSLVHYRAAIEQLRLARYLRRSRVEIVHSYGFYSNVFALPAARLAQVPVIIASIRDTGEMLTPAQKLAQKYACKLAHYVLVNADAVRDWLVEQGYDGRKIRVIRNGIVLPRFAARAGNDFRHEFGLPPNVPLVGVVARLNAMKGIEYFLQAAAAVAPEAPDAWFLIVGDGGHKEELQRLAGALGIADRVVFTGFQMDVPRVLSELTISVLPTLSEGLSNTLLESMAMGIPVIATIVGGNPEAVGDCGVLVPPRDAAALADAMLMMLRNPGLAARMGQSGRCRIVESFSLERMVRDTQSFYVDLAAQRSGRSATAVASKIA